MNTAIRFLLWSSLLVALVIFPACHMDREIAGPLQTDTQTEKLLDAKSVHVDIKMGAGNLKVGGGGSELLDAEFTYNTGHRPNVNYRVEGSEGKLEIEEPTGGRFGGNRRNDWDLRLNKSVPMAMSVEQGAGNANLTLGGLSLDRLDVKTGVGDTTVDLAGIWKRDVSVHVKGGIGNTTLRLPMDVGVSVEAHGGIGSISGGDLQKHGDNYENDAYGKSSVTIRVEVEHGIGNINLELSGGPPVV